jgi:FKBP-type peptidyl-prolyl cis-trans isomerase FkpA
MFKRLFAALRGTPAPGFYLPTEAEVELRPSGLAVQVLEPGGGRSPEATDTVTVRYAGWTPDGKRFDASYPGTASFPLNRVIGGWTEGLQLLRPGGSARLVIPPGLAYGPRGAPPRIGPNATLVFHVELVSVDS